MPNHISVEDFQGIIAPISEYYKGDGYGGEGTIRAVVEEQMVTDIGRKVADSLGVLQEGNDLITRWIFLRNSLEDAYLIKLLEDAIAGTLESLQSQGKLKD